MISERPGVIKRDGVIARKMTAFGMLGRARQPPRVNRRLSTAAQVSTALSTVNRLTRESGSHQTASSATQPFSVCGLATEAYARPQSSRIRFSGGTVVCPMPPRDAQRACRRRRRRFAVPPRAFAARRCEIIQIVDGIRQLDFAHIRERFGFLVAVTAD